MTPVKAIRAYCLDCGGGSPKEVRLCPCIDCPLYSFRMGKNPNYLNSKNKNNKLSYEQIEQIKTHGNLPSFEQSEQIRED